MSGALRKHEQNQILELVKTLGEAAAELKHLAAQKDTAAILQVLADCQEGAVQIGSYIEQIEGEGTGTVSYLEEYCELLYEISTQAEKPDPGITKRLRRQLIKIENSIRTELKPNKTEIVFLPYKASMWDALESVWRAAQDDPQCDVYVVPIPYYDRLPGGAFGKMHYEGDLYPAEVQVTHWMDYDLEERHPDAIFIHNPYDEANIVTSVPLEYYSKRLREYTDLLCYIPYFVMMDDVPDIFCTLPGVLYADRVFVQSERVRNTYIRVFKEFERKHGCVGRFGRIEEKIVAAGSPKFDKALGARPEEYTLPEAWERLIVGPGGTAKKVVFYNTSIGAILQGDAQYIKKIRFVLDTFREREDVVLWWRPHPLNEATYEVMRPQLLHDYEQIIADYTREGWGIYDESAQLHRAIACSDAYYGDMSSLAVMYLCTGKPAMVQEASATGTNASLWLQRIFHDGIYLWSAVTNFNGLFRIDPRDWAVEYMGSFPDEPFLCSNLYTGIAQHGGKLYFAPGTARQVGVYDPQSNAFARLGPVDLFASHHEYRRKYNACYSYQDCVFFVGCSHPAIVKYDTVTGAFTRYDDWAAELDKLPRNHEKLFFIKGCIVGSKLILPLCCASAILEFDMEGCVGRVIPNGNGVDGYSEACFDGQEVWLAPRHGTKAAAWNAQTGAWREIQLEGIEAVPEGGMLYTSIVYTNDTVWLLAAQADKSFKIDVQTGEVCVAEEMQPEGSAKDVAIANMPQYWNAVAAEDVVYAQNLRSGALIAYDAGAKQRRETLPQLEKNAVEALWLLAAESLAQTLEHLDTLRGCCYYEHQFPYGFGFNVDRLDTYINQVVQKPGSPFAKVVSGQAIQCFQKENAHTDGTAGEHIYALQKRAASNARIRG